MNDSEGRWWCIRCQKFFDGDYEPIEGIVSNHFHGEPGGVYVVFIPDFAIAALQAEQRQKDINALCAAVPPCSLRDNALAAIREGKEE